MVEIDAFVSVVAVVKDHSQVLPQFVRQVFALLDEHYTNFEILLIDNGSRDETLAMAKRLLTEVKCLRYQRLSRTVDDETAVVAGLDAAIGDYVGTIHPDFDPPEEIVPMIESCRSGYDVVLGKERLPVRPSLPYRLSRSAFLKLSHWLVGLDLPIGTTGLRVFSRHAVNAMTRVRSRRRYFALIAADIGLTTVLHPYERISRSGVKPIRRFGRALRLGLSVLIHYSILPLRLVSLLGIAGSGLSLLYSVYVLLVYLFNPGVMPGWTTLSLQVSGLFSIVFLMLALLSEYVGRLLEESTDRPLYHVRDEQSSTVMLADPTRRNVLDRSEFEQNDWRNPKP